MENGTTGEVIAVDPAARPSAGADARGEAAGDGDRRGGDEPSGLDLYYAAHVVKSQGTTVRRSYVVAGGWQTSRETLYVACSRAREGTRLFVDRESLGSEVEREALAEMVRRSAESRAKLAAIEGKAAPSAYDPPSAARTPVARPAARSGRPTAAGRGRARGWLRHQPAARVRWGCRTSTGCPRLRCRRGGPTSADGWTASGPPIRISGPSPEPRVRVSRDSAAEPFPRCWAQHPGVVSDLCVLRTVARRAARGSRVGRWRAGLA